MTRDQFKKLTRDQQDEFLSSGEALVSEVPLPVGSSGGSQQVSPEGVGELQSDLLSSPPSQPPPPNKIINLHPEYQDGFDIKDPLELLFLLDDDVIRSKANNGIDLHPWQIQFLIDFAQEMWSDQNPFQAVVRACNGSGKDKYIIAPCVVWLCMRFRLARGIVTSSSGVQLDNQTDAYILQLCQSANRKYAGGREEIWKCNYRYYECIPTESPIVLFATDEAGKAEGYHPLAYGRKMVILASEDKTIPDEINTGLNKCTGYTHRCHVSTPGLPLGHFFDYCQTAVPRESLKQITDKKPEDYIHYLVTAYDCSHIPKAYIEQMKRDLPGGEMGAAFKSQVLAEFGTTDEMVVIPYTYIWRSYTHTPQYPQPKWIPEAQNKAGLDLSDGGDETVLTIRNGNKHLKTIPFRFDNTEDTIAFLDEKFKEHELNNPESYIFSDCGGLGKPMLDRLKRMGWSNIRYVDNRARAFRPTTYLNRGTEMWFEIRKLFERHELIVLKDDKLVRQLSTRYYKIDQGNRHRLLSKLESRSRGYPSPDRADSFILAFSDYKTTFKESKSEDNKPFEQPKVKEKPIGCFTQQHLVSSKSDSIKRRLGKRPSMDVYQMQIDQHNRWRKLNTQTVEQPTEKI